MALEIYHQLGNNAVWNFTSLDEDHTGDGVIISPRNIEKTKVEEYPENRKNRAIFDPQFFIPDHSKQQLKTYEFYPANVIDEFSTKSFIEDNANDCAEACVNFQIENGFRFIIIPTRYVSGMPSDFFANQERLFIKPHIDSLNDKPNHNQVLLEIILNEQMINDPDYNRDLLNWLTGIEGIDGVYLILERPTSPKQFQDENIIFNYLKFINVIKANGIFVVLGYLGLESLVYSVALPDIITIGTYDSTKIFPRKSFQQNQSKQGGGGPKPRVYFSKLLQSINIKHMSAFKAKLDNFESLLDNNRHLSEMRSKDPKAKKLRASYYHYLLVFSNQLRSMSNLDGDQLYKEVSFKINKANHYFTEISKAGIPLDIDNNGNHLNIWQKAMNRFAKDQGWI